MFYLCIILKFGRELVVGFGTNEERQVAFEYMTSFREVKGSYWKNEKLFVKLDEITTLQITN